MNEFEYNAIITFIVAVFLATTYVATLTFMYYEGKGGKK